MNAVNRSDVEDFLFAEADLLDQWRLPEWLTLFTEDAKYEVPCTDLAPDASPDTSLFYIADDRVRLGERVKRLMKRTAHAEFPHSRTSRIVGNVRIRGRTEREIDVSCVFQTLRTKDGTTDLYFGTSNYKLATDGEGLKIREKRCLLGSEGLRPSGRISIVL
ncbi:aromatic-ring-hydroxylating dioxygenase subunit beta [Bradyrhizobium diversitatis]|uniref:Aromatic-ring-hydroxylating dioxygenase subunit beta n=1 Tax=Bradyrhizobium diversitatis TaxID=2755406 RepID=A0ABS0PBW4_9BRAD|nr:aromatic-ring-hydroxylating dioxygenase subunit beta [Bradyrhizobium diversitatis]KYK47729.1 aromatic-ring-hydroxylating dioxygenase subunit beta [Bradyrhizobium liaoningense]MBH5390800.1 aromatic-ring-hydroxylating dioxygenase subunit beta [Bradyrhizobium diversitatis]